MAKKIKDAKVKIKDVFKITGRGIVAESTILEGTINTGDEIVLGKKKYMITGVEMFCSTIPNYNVGLVLRGSADHNGSLDEFKEAVLKFKGKEVLIKNKK